VVVEVVEAVVVNPPTPHIRTCIELLYLGLSLAFLTHPRQQQNLSTRQEQPTKRLKISNISPIGILRVDIIARLVV